MAEPIANVLGIVSIKHCGEYDSGTYYEKLNVVTYQGSSYCAKTSTIGNLPTDTTYWDLMVEKGDKGDTGDDGYTPVKGTDYYTAADKAALEADLADDVSDEVSDQLSTLVSATPLLAETAADMTDTTRIYVLATDGHWYWYDGADWQDGGVYQATELEDGSVAALKTNFFTHNDLLNGVEITNERLNSSNGGSSSSTSFRMSDYVPVTDGQVIYLHGTFDRLRYYNANKVSINEIIDDTNISNTSKTIPTRTGNPVKFIRIDWDSRVNDTPDVNLFDPTTIKQLIPIDEIKNARTIGGTTYANLNTALNTTYNSLNSAVEEATDNKKIYFRYDNYSWPILNVFMKTKNDKYLRYEFTHMIVPEVNSDVWRLRAVMACTKNNDNTFTPITDEIVHRGSEWECAIKEANEATFVGGSTHGNELLTDIVFFLDGIRYDNPANLNGLSGYELRVIRRSELYRYSDSTKNIASHYVDYLFKDNTITIDNRINWKVDTTLGISFMTMLGLKRTNSNGQVSSYGIKEGDGALLNISTIPYSYGSTKHCRKAYAFNDSIAGIKTLVSVELLEDDYLPNSKFHFEDGANYNKMYFDHCGTNYSITNGDIWHTKSQYKIDYFGTIE